MDWRSDPWRELCYLIVCGTVALICMAFGYLVSFVLY